MVCSPPPSYESRALCHTCKHAPHCPGREARGTSSTTPTTSTCPTQPLTHPFPLSLTQAVIRWTHYLARVLSSRPSPKSPPHTRCPSRPSHQPHLPVTSSLAFPLVPALQPCPHHAHYMRRPYSTTPPPANPNPPSPTSTPSLVISFASSS